MPRLNGTGPEGKGSMTGRGMGNCQPNNDNSKEDENIGFGRGFGRGRGMRKGFGCRQGR